MLYQCDLVEKNYGHVMVEAESWEEAYAKARDLYNDGEVEWGQTIVDIDIEEVDA